MPTMSGVRRHSLTIFFLVLFVAALVGQALTGWAQFNDQQTAQNLAEISLGRYLRSADFAVDVTENWQSEYLLLLLCCLVAVGSARGAPLPRSVGLIAGVVFLASWVAQSIAGRAAFNETRMHHLQDPIGWGAYLRDPDFWARTLQNWQSEFLVAASVALVVVYLRRRGCDELERVPAWHE